MWEKKTQSKTNFSERWHFNYNENEKLIVLFTPVLENGLYPPKINLCMWEEKNGNKKNEVYLNEKQFDFIMKRKAEIGAIVIYERN